jgi:hypothetical protein
MTLRKLVPVGMLALAAATLPAAAQPAPSNLAPIAKEQSGTVSQVYWRGRGRGWGWGVAPWIGLGVVTGAIIANETYRPRPGYYYDDYAYDGPYYYPANYRGDPRTVCAENFRSFEWRTGLYTTYNGEKRLCPYLR